METQRNANKDIHTGNKKQLFLQLWHNIMETFPAARDFQGLYGFNINIENFNLHKWCLISLVRYVYYTSANRI